MIVTKNVFKDMSKKLLVVSLLCICVVAGSLGYVGYSAIENYFMFHQSLTVPNQASMSVYQSDGVTLIGSGSDLMANWIWTGTQFTLSLVIKNTGNIALQTGLNTASVPAGWAVSITGNGTLNTGATQPVTVIAIPPSLAGGTSSGDFDLWLRG